MFESCIDFVTQVQNFFDQLLKFPFAYVLFNFAMASVVSFISFPIYIAEIKNIFDLLNYLEKISTQKRSIRRNIYLFGFRYAIVTGFGATGLLYIQYHGPNFGTAIIYGLLGPYCIKERISTQLDVELDMKRDEVIKNLEKKVEFIGGEETDKPYFDEIEKIKSDLLKDQIPALKK